MPDKEILFLVFEKAWPAWEIDRFWIDFDDYSWKNILFERAYYPYIFSHDFARAFWGEEMHEVYATSLVYTNAPAWKYHLQMMVLQPEPLKYLEKFL